MSRYGRHYQEPSARERVKSCATCRNCSTVVDMVTKEASLTCSIGGPMVLCIHFRDAAAPVDYSNYDGRFRR